MATNKLTGKRVAILATDGVEQVELTEPRGALNAAGAETKIVSPKADRVRSWRFTEWGEYFPVDQSLAQARALDFRPDAVTYLRVGRLGP